MPGPRRSSRGRYDRVSAVGDADEEGSSSSSSPSSSGTGTGTGAGALNLVGSDLEASLGEPLTSSSSIGNGAPASPPSSLSAPEGSDAAAVTNSGSGDGGGLERRPAPPDGADGSFVVVVLDTAHSKFRVPASPSWTVRRFKAAGAASHGVPVKSQRLVHMGKLLKDADTLEGSGIAESERIVHLFPKPNVVVTTGGGRGDKVGGGSAEDDENEGAGENDGAGAGRAHVPQIVLDAAEAERRSQILILSSTEVFEAQHRVKLLSLLLLIICSMELLTLFTIMLGVPEDGSGAGGGFGPNSDDDIPPGDPTGTSPYGGASGADDAVRRWRTSDYFDLIVSGFGFYVATLGIKATTENTSATATLYFRCLVLCGIMWNAYYYYLNVRAQRDIQAHADSNSNGGGGGSSHLPSDTDDEEIYANAFFGIVLPMCVWLVCFLRAYQFRQLIEEAESEAEERTRSLATGAGGGDSNDNEDDRDSEDTEGDERQRAEPDHDTMRGGRHDAVGRLSRLSRRMDVPFGGESTLNDLELQVQMAGRTFS